MNNRSPAAVKNGPAQLRITNDKLVNALTNTSQTNGIVSPITDIMTIVIIGTDFLPPKKANAIGSSKL